MTQTIKITYDALEESLLDFLHANGLLPIMEGPVSLDIPMPLDDDGLITIGLDVVEVTPVIEDITDEPFDAGLHRYLGAEILQFPVNV